MYFQHQEEQEQEELRQAEEILSEIFTAETMRPIVTEDNRTVRQTALNEYYRDLRQLGNAYRAEQQRRFENEVRRVHQPNLSVPVGDSGDWRALPQ